MKKILLIAIAVAVATNLKAQTTATNLAPRPAITKTTDSLKKDSVAKPAATTFSKFRLGGSGGLSFLLAKISDRVPSASRDYVKELKSGAHFSVDATYFWKENIGLGLKYINFNSRNEGQAIVDDILNPPLKYINDIITTQFIGPVLYSRFYSKNRKTEFLLAYGLGYLDYRNKGYYGGYHRMIKGGTIGLDTEISADFYLAKKLSLGFGVGFVAGALRKLNFQQGNFAETIELEEGEYEGLNRLDIFTGLRWKL